MSPRPISSTDSSRLDAFSHSHSSLPQLGDLHGGRYPPSPAVSNLVPPECPPSFSQGKPRFLLCPFLCRDPQGCPGPLQGNPSLAPSGSIRPEVQLGPGQAPEAELGLGGVHSPSEQAASPQGVISPWVIKLLRQDGLVGRDRRHGHGMQGRSVPALSLPQALPILPTGPLPQLLGLNWAPSSHHRALG